jgi:hypothetical protein
LAASTLSPGTRLGPYDILSACAREAWGEVYRADDWKLDRDVAIKSCLKHGPLIRAGIACFEREARTCSNGVQDFHEGSQVASACGQALLQLFGPFSMTWKPILAASLHRLSEHKKPLAVWRDIDSAHVLERPRSAR